MLNPVVAGCLDRIRKGEMIAVGVLADCLEEIKHPLAGRVRKSYQRAEAAIRWTNTTDWKHTRKRSRWENVALWQKWLWNRVRTLFKRTWKRKPLGFFA